MFIGVVSLRRARESELEWRWARDGFSGNAGQGESRRCIQVLSVLHLPSRQTDQRTRGKRAATVS